MGQSRAIGRQLGHIGRAGRALSAVIMANWSSGDVTSDRKIAPRSSRPGDLPSGRVGKSESPSGRVGKSESPARGDLYVVVGPSTTEECRGWTIHDKRGRRRTSQQAHVTQKSHWPRAARPPGPDDHGESAAREPRAPSDDHGSTASGAWHARPEIAPRSSRPCGLPSGEGWADRKIAPRSSRPLRPSLRGELGKSEGGTAPLPHMILKDFPEGYGTSFRITGGAAGGTAIG